LDLEARDDTIGLDEEEEEEGGGEGGEGEDSDGALEAQIRAELNAEVGILKARYAKKLKSNIAGPTVSAVLVVHNMFADIHSLRHLPQQFYIPNCLWHARRL
jgi:hypothetical protein